LDAVFVRASTSVLSQKHAFGRWKGVATGKMAVAGRFSPSQLLGTPSQVAGGASQVVGRLSQLQNRSSQVAGQGARLGVKKIRGENFFPSPPSRSSRDISPGIFFHSASGVLPSSFPK
jgi:hypothetical protein